MRPETFKKDQVLKFCEEHAKDAPFGKCMDLANQFQRLGDEEYFSACVLAVLSSYFCNEHGALIRERMPSEMTPILNWAFDRVQYRHAWVSCGPVTDGMNKFLKRMEEKHCSGFPKKEES